MKILTKMDINLNETIEAKNIINACDIQLKNIEKTKKMRKWSDTDIAVK